MQIHNQSDVRSYRTVQRGSFACKKVSNLQQIYLPIQIECSFRKSEKEVNYSANSVIETKHYYYMLKLIHSC